MALPKYSKQPSYKTSPIVSVNKKGEHFAFIVFTRYGFKTEEPNGGSVTSQWGGKALHTCMANQMTTERSPQICRMRTPQHLLQEWKDGTLTCQPLAFCRHTQQHRVHIVPSGAISQGSLRQQCTRTICIGSTQDRPWHPFWRVLLVPTTPRNSVGRVLKIWDTKLSSTARQAHWPVMEAKLLN